jgi:hypothetical protein
VLNCAACSDKHHVEYFYSPESGCDSYAKNGGTHCDSLLEGGGKPIFFIKLMFSIANVNFSFCLVELPKTLNL